MSETAVVPFLSPAVEQRWLTWHSAPLGRSGATIVESEMVDWSGAVPPSLETVVHVLLPGSAPAYSVRDFGDGRHDIVVRAGQVCITPAAQPRYYAWRGRFGGLSLIIPKKLLAHTAGDAGLTTVPDLMSIARGPREDRLIEGIVHRLGCVGRGELQILTAEIDHAVALVICWLLRQTEPKLAPRQGGLSPTALRRVRAYVDEHLERDLSVSELADLVGLSTPYFSRAFRKSTGEPPYKFILRRRCAKACELLRGQSALSDIALAVGFTAQSHFTTAFRRVVGTTPAAWRHDRSD